MYSRRAVDLTSPASSGVRMEISLARPADDKGQVHIISGARIAASAARKFPVNSKLIEGEEEVGSVSLWTTSSHKKTEGGRMSCPTLPCSAKASHLSHTPARLNYYEIELTGPRAISIPASMAGGSQSAHHSYGIFSSCTTRIPASTVPGFYDDVAGVAHVKAV